MKFKAQVKMRYSDPVIRNILNAPSGMVGQYLARLGREVATSARRRAPHASGQLAGSITSEVQGRGGSLQAVVTANARHAMWVHEGTGIYGPRGRYILPRSGKFMTWQEGGEWVVARRVAGIPKRPYLRDAMEAVINRRSI